MVQFVNDQDPNEDTREEFPHESVFEAQLEEINVRLTPRKDGKGDNQWVDFWFRITGSDLGEQFIGRRVKGSAFGSLKAQAGDFGRFNRWSAALLGKEEIELGYHLDTDDLIGLTATIMIVQKPDRRDPARTWPEVEEVVSNTAPTSAPAGGGNPWASQSPSWGQGPAGDPPF